MKRGKTIIMVTHDVMVGSFASRLLYIQDGTIKEQLSRKEFKTTGRLVSIIFQK